jgi:DNA-binding MarR family transcriptional regulator
MSVEARILRELSERDAANNEELAKRMGMRKDVVGKAVKELRTQGRIASGERGLSLVLGLVPG